MCGLYLVTAVQGVSFHCGAYELLIVASLVAEHSLLSIRISVEVAIETRA